MKKLEKNSMKKKFINFNKSNLEEKIEYFKIDKIQPEHYERRILDRIKENKKNIFFSF